MNSFEQNLIGLAERANAFRENIKTEEATKSALVMPFLQLLGYDVFNPLEVIPEYVADVSGKKGEKVDYCILNNGQPAMIIECKHWQENLDLHNTQLERYFAFTQARFGILTNGILFRFYTDLDAKNKMDIKPFFEFDLGQPKEAAIAELRKFHKSEFDPAEIADAASELRYIKEVRRMFEVELREPSDAFVEVFARKIHTGRFTDRIRDQFRAVVRRAINQMINETISDRLHKALHKEAEQQQEEVVEQDPAKQVVFHDEERGIFTTQEELDGFEIVKDILKDVIEPERIQHRDTRSYFGILLDDNNRKPICRLRLDGGKKYLILFDEEKNDTRHRIGRVEHIYKHARELVDTVTRYIDN